jgi:hypothetical protein
VAFLPHNPELPLAFLSFTGGMNFVLNVDIAALPDIQDIADGIEVALAELVALAKRRRGRAGTEPAAKANGGAPGRRGRRRGTAVPVSR